LSNWIYLIGHLPLLVYFFHFTLFAFGVFFQMFTGVLYNMGAFASKTVRGDEHDDPVNDVVGAFVAGTSMAWSRKSFNNIDSCISRFLSN
jgi:hypothetical protein